MCLVEVIKLSQIKSIKSSQVKIPRKHVNQVNLGQSPAPTTAQTRLIRSVDSNSALATLVELGH
jgi:hypothetical protein